ncbi:hypothetical protein QTG54_010661 [Skeletonema marinoi]|uniref:Uncharacterized protein n=1 Tax=Skeletonema marinoi TaxID=267567 RepID=A0AAD8Y4F6_9STRA|nr:hypothetical protein QTG54_010661 [Skeletonema marinoi]
MSSEDDDSNSTDAIVMERSSSCHSLRSMPLQKDDDYFYYHGDGGTEDDEDGDGETVDHIGLLIGPAIVQNRTTNMERDFRDSLRSMTSEVTSDWNDNDAGSQDELHSTTQECIGLKLQIADLKAQLDDQKFHYREKYNAAVSSLQDRNLSLECENVVLKQKLQESEDAALRERVEARRVERLLQDKVELMAREVQLSQDRKHHDQAMRRRSSTSGDTHNVSNCREEEYLPFPQSHNATRRLSASFVAVGRRPSLLESMCQSFRKNSNDIPAMSSSQVSSMGSDDSDTICHDSWANVDEINAQTEIFNKKSISKLFEGAAKKGCPESELVRSSRRNSTMCSQQPVPTSPRRKVQRRKSFALGERPPSLKDLFSKSRREEQGIDVESEIWDCPGENAALESSSNSVATDYHTVLTAGW